MNNDILDVFGPVEDTTTDIIKVVGVGGGGCNAVGNMYHEGMKSVTFAVCNTDSKSLSVNPVPTKIMLGKSGHGAGADPKKGREEAEQNIEDLKRLFSDHTQMTFIVCAMGGGTGTGAGPFVAGIAKELGLLTIGIVTLPFYFEKRPKIIKALRGIDEMRANVDALLIINNEQISKVFSDSHIPVNEALRRADAVMANAVRSISELITLNGKIQTDLADVKTTMKNGGGAIMAIGRASGEHRVQKAVLNALQSPLLYGSDISKATRILFNIYTSSEHELFVDELEEIDAFMDELKRMAGEHVIFTGFQQGQVLEELYSNAYIYTLPSDLEGMPLSLLEAMSYGNCCIVSDIPECLEVVEDKAAAFMKSDVGDLRRELQQFLDNPKLVDEYKKKAADFICRKYNWDDVVCKTLELYRR